MAPHSHILAWRTPCTEEPDGLQSMQLPRVSHNLATKPPHHSLNIFPRLESRGKEELTSSVVHHSGITVPQCLLSSISQSDLVGACF